MNEIARQALRWGILANLVFLKKSKNFLFLILCFIWSNTGNAELLSGHDRQRLALIFINSLETYFKNTPVQISLSQFPLEIVKHDDEARFNLYQVLAEEGWLSVAKASTALKTESDDRNYTQLFNFSVHPDRKVEKFIPVAAIKIQEITSINKQNVDGATFYQVQFNWQSSEVAPWLWAQSLAPVNNVALLKSSLNSSKQASAQFKWDGAQWLLIQAPQLFTPE